ncbi:glycosyltransferase, partial [Paraburkholderia sediminicola]
MKIVHVIESSATGTLAVVRMVANRLAREGHKVYVIYSRREDTPVGLRAQFDPSIALCHIRMRGPNFPKVIWGLRRMLMSIEPDIVHLHSSFAGFFGRLASILALKSTAFFYSPHCISFMRTDVSFARKLAFAAFELIACVRECMYVACSESEKAAVEAYLKRSAVLVENA